MSQAPVEVEMKIPIEDIQKTRLALLEIGAQIVNSEVQIDSYYDHPCKSFWETDEALRIRTRQSLSDDHGLMPHSGSLTEMTYKGPKIDSISKTRAEIAVGIDSEQGAELLLQNLGFKGVAKVAKTRSFYVIDEITISIDDVVDVGIFLELERIVHDESEVEPARDEILRVLGRLGLDSSRSIRKSYLELYLERNPR